MNISIPTKLLAAVCGWAARISGALLVVFIVLLAIGEGMPNPFTQPLRIELGFLGLALLMIGILIGWRWELLGGVMSLIGWCVFFTSVIFPSRNRIWVEFGLALPGLLYVTSALFRHKRDCLHLGHNS